ncbi:MAG: hypothetical protein GXY68_07480, partial [Chloroflexi bacterium]|nr:hypothetical protein [Chloroflexota bacterium]
MTLRLGRWLLVGSALCLLLGLLLVSVTAAGATAAGATAAVAAADAPTSVAHADLGGALPPDAVVYIHEGAVWLAAADGTAARALSSNGRALEAALSPDGRQVAYLLAPPAVLAAGMAPLPVQLWLTDLATGETHTLLDSLVERSQLAWSPDGARLALVQGASLQVLTLQRSAEAGALYAVSSQAVAVETLSADGLAYSSYAWAPDSSGLVALLADAADHQRLVRVDAEGLVDLPLPDELATGDPELVAVALHPAGQTLALLDGRGGLWAIAPFGANPEDSTPLVTSEVALAAFAWAPDGRQLAYADRRGGLWLAPTDAAGLPNEAAVRLGRLSAPALALQWREGRLCA